MSAIVEQRDGYGWLIGTNVGTGVDQYGPYAILSAGAPASYSLTKTIYVEHCRNALVFFSKTFRVYNTSGTADVVTIDTSNVLPVSGEIVKAVAANGYLDVLIEGYADDNNPTLAFKSASYTDLRVYLIAESGY